MNHEIMNEVRLLQLVLKHQQHGEVVLTKHSVLLVNDIRGHLVFLAL
jgi:hypothetical protein